MSVYGWRWLQTAVAVYSTKAESALACQIVVRERKAAASVKLVAVRLVRARSDDATSDHRVISVSMKALHIDSSWRQSIVRRCYVRRMRVAALQIVEGVTANRSRSAIARRKEAHVSHRRAHQLCARSVAYATCGQQGRERRMAIVVRWKFVTSFALGVDWMHEGDTTITRQRFSMSCVTYMRCSSRKWQTSEIVSFEARLRAPIFITSENVNMRP